MSSTPVQQAVMEHFAIKYSVLVGESRLGPVVLARHVAFYLERDVVQRSFPEIARLYGARDPSTVMAAYKHMVERLSRGDERYEPHVAALRPKVLAERMRGFINAEALTCPTCGGPVIQELQRQLAALMQRLNEVEKTR